MRVVLVNGEQADEIGLVHLLQRSGAECVSRRISAACLHTDQHVVWRMASGYPSPITPPEAPTPHQPRGVLFELTEPNAAAIAAVAAVREDPRFDAFPVIASLSIDHIDWISRAREFDDFLFSPWSPIELFGRIYAAERRRADAVAQRREAVEIDTSARQVTIDGCAIRLTVRECALLSHLWEQRGSVLSREHLLAHVWGERYHGGARTVDVHIRRLRSKLGSALPIDTVRGGGYRLLAPGEAPPTRGGFASGAPRRPTAGLRAPSAVSTRADAEVSSGFEARAMFPAPGLLGHSAAQRAPLQRSF